MQKKKIQAYRCIAWVYVESPQFPLLDNLPNLSPGLILETQTVAFRDTRLDDDLDLAP